MGNICDCSAQGWAGQIHNTDANFWAYPLEHIYFMNKTEDNFSHREVLRSQIYPNFNAFTARKSWVDILELEDKYILDTRR